MNIWDMIENDKVEWKRLGEVCEIQRGVRVTKNELIENALYPVVSGGIGYMGFLNKYNREGNTITIAQYGTAGYVGWQNEKFWANDVCYTVKPFECINNRYLYYFLLNMQEYLYLISNRNAIPYSISKENILKISIPIPSLETQEKIAEILDDFEKNVTELKEKLSVELQLRNKQYNYYKDLLLSEEKLLELSGVELESFELKDVFNTKNGYTPSKNNEEYWNKNEIPWFRLEDIRMNGNILNNSILYVSKNAVKGNVFPEDSIILSTSATIGEYALIKIPFLANQRFTCFSLKNEFKEKLNIKYVYYYFNIVSDWCKKNIKIGNFPSVDVDNLLLEKIIIPPLPIQNYIVSILDSFDSMVNDIRDGLPFEIELRQKQYEYYREKLLDFSN